MSALGFLEEIRHQLEDLPPQFRMLRTTDDVLEYVKQAIALAHEYDKALNVNGRMREPERNARGCADGQRHHPAYQRL